MKKDFIGPCRKLKIDKIFRSKIVEKDKEIIKKIKVKIKIILHN